MSKHRTESHTKRRDEKLEKMIDNLELTLMGMDPETENYAIVAENLGRLMELKHFRDKSALEHKSKKQKMRHRFKTRIDPNTAIQVTGFLTGIVLCIHAEQVGPIVTKAFSIVPRMIGGIRRA